ncbi:MULTISPECIES: Rid family detoxifying hydrolase [unclassified Lysinibacillus]|uniref:Rid family detoxifying hydrolase n=1 Tax=unclassified Lysinibacillus TaxID=2636778 RepID=UPI0025539666|nr:MULTISPECIES: Rid family detoxifying hydrolase [unclassified Lysinibacillus]MDM5247822.1 Rid family detoxifying hydrolase [Lysinibacillus sp. G4S2]
MSIREIYTNKAPEPIGTYSQAILSNNIVFLSAQAPIVPETMEVVEGGIKEQIQCSFNNLKSVVEATGGNLSNIVKLTVYLTDLTHFSLVNEEMAKLFTAPYPARAAVGVKALPKGTDFAVEAIMSL